MNLFRLASTCNTVGQTLGYCFSYAGFIALNDANFSLKVLGVQTDKQKGVVDLPTFIAYDSQYSAANPAADAAADAADAGVAGVADAAGAADAVDAADAAAVAVARAVAGGGGHGSAAAAAAAAAAATAAAAAATAAGFVCMCGV